MNENTTNNSEKYAIDVEIDDKNYIDSLKNIKDSVKTVNGYAIELWDNTQNNWELCLFVQFKDKEFLHYSFVQMIGTIYERGYELEWEI